MVLKIELRQSSSLLRSIGYFVGKQLDMIIGSGKRYRYFGVSKLILKTSEVKQ